MIYRKSLFFFVVLRAFWQQRLNEEYDRSQQETDQLKQDYDEQIRTLSQQINSSNSQNTEYLQVKYQLFELNNWLFFLF